MVGAGLIGSIIDEPGTKQPLTHAGAYHFLGCQIVGIVDSGERLYQESIKWNSRPYLSISNMLDECRPEIISFSVPTFARADLMLEALECDSLKVVIAEKPLADSIQSASLVVEAYKKRNIPLIINYSRRFIPVWQSLAGSAAISATIKYAKGINHNGTHAIDLCRMIFGECLSATGLRLNYDYWSNDPSVTGHLSFERCADVILQAMDEKYFTLFEVDIIASDWRIIVDSDGRRLRRFEVKNNLGTPPGSRLIQVEENDTGSSLAMLNLIEHAMLVAHGDIPKCSGDDAIIAISIANKLRSV